MLYIFFATHIQACIKIYLIVHNFLQDGRFCLLTPADIIFICIAYTIG